MSASSTAAARAYSSAAGEPEGSRSRIRSALTATTSSAAIATLAESSAWSAMRAASGANDACDSTPPPAVVV